MKTESYIIQQSLEKRYFNSTEQFFSQHSTCPWRNFLVIYYREQSLLLSDHQKSNTKMDMYARLDTIRTHTHGERECERL